jgi:CBS domain-containing protein
MERVTLARDIMTTEVVTLSASASLVEAAEQMIEQRVSSAPVVEVDFTRKILVGFVSEKDLMQAWATGAFHADASLEVSDVMRPHPVAVRPDADIYTLAAIFMQHGFRHVPVVSAGMLLGVVSRRDVLAALVIDYRRWSRLDPKTRTPPDLSGIFTPRYLLG